MFRNLNQAWAELEAGMLSAHDDDRAKSMISFGRELFFVGAYTSQTMMDCIAKFTEDPDEALAQLAELRGECRAALGNSEVLHVHMDIDPKDQYFQIHDPDA